MWSTTDGWVVPAVARGFASRAAGMTAPGSLKCPKCGTEVRERSGRGTAIYRIWKCNKCATFFDRKGSPPAPPRTEAEHDVANQIELGVRVRACRDSLGWSLRDLAAASGVSRAYLGEIESGVGNPTLLIVIQIATALGVDVAELTGGLRALRGCRVAMSPIADTR